MKSNPLILLCFAVKQEAAPTLAIARSHPDWRVLITGMGPRNATRVLRAALALARPRLVLSCGFAGALNPQLVRGDLVFAADDPFPLRPVLLEMGARPIQFHGVDRIIATAAEKAGLWKTTGADAVDMESAAIRALCREANLPSATVRVISDAAQDDLPLDFNQFLRPDQGLHYGKLLLGLLASPRAIKPLITLNQHTRAGARALAQCLQRVLGENHTVAERRKGCGF